MNERIKVVETITLSEDRTIQTRETVENPTPEDFRGVIAWVNICEIARIEIVRPVVEVFDPLGVVVDYARKGLTTITIKLKGD